MVEFSGARSNVFVHSATKDSLLVVGCVHHLGEGGSVSLTRFDPHTVDAVVAEEVTLERIKDNGRDLAAYRVKGNPFDTKAPVLRLTDHVSFGESVGLLRTTPEGFGVFRGNVNGFRDKCQTLLLMDVPSLSGTLVLNKFLRPLGMATHRISSDRPRTEQVRVERLTFMEGIS